MRPAALLVAAALAAAALCARALPTADSALVDLSGPGPQRAHAPFARPAGVPAWGPRRIQLKEGAEPVLMGEEDIMALKRAGRRFMDVTDWPEDLPAVAWAADAPASPRAGPAALPKKLAYQPLVKALFANISEDRCRDFLTTFSGFPTRYYRSASGVESATWLMGQVRALADGRRNKDDVTVTVRAVNNTNFAQFNIVARVERVLPDAAAAAAHKKKPMVIVSAHQDSVNAWNPWFGRAPGADDDGSGTTTVVEALRVYLASGLAPARPIEFHWYAGEEGGLLGSQRVAGLYKQEGAAVRAVLHMDMAGWTGEEKGRPEVIGVGQDYVDAEATKFMEALIDEYLTIPKVYTQCGYACSDHASWTKAGYPAVFPLESAFPDSNPYIHTTSDTVAHISFSHVAQHVRLVLAWLVELGGLFDEDGA